MPGPPLAGVVLAGGAGRRMGADKAALVVDGERLVVRLARLLATVADPVLLATGTAGRLGPLGWAEVPDAVPDQGPLAGLAAGLAASPHRLTAVVAVDLPFASPAVLALLARTWAGEDAVVPLVDDRPEPLHAVYATTVASAARAALAAGRRGVLDLLDGLRVRVVPPAEWAPADPEGRFALNLNTPEDLDRLP